jgi:hypothetical protein
LPAYLAITCDLPEIICCRNGMIARLRNIKLDGTGNEAGAD